MSTTLARTNGTQPIGLAMANDPLTIGKVLADSGFFQDSRGAAQAAVKVMAGAELGFGPVASMTGIYIVKNRVTISANLMAAAIKRHPNYTFRVREHTSEVCTIDFIEKGEAVGTSSFTIEDAKTAGLLGSDNYRKFARNMLFARALSNGAKWHCPDVFGGPVYTPDELGAEVDGETGDVIDVPQHEPVALIEGGPATIGKERAGALAGTIRFLKAEGLLDADCLYEIFVEAGANPVKPVCPKAVGQLTPEQATVVQRELASLEGPGAIA